MTTEIPKGLATQAWRGVHFASAIDVGPLLVLGDWAEEHGDSPFAERLRREAAFFARSRYWLLTIHPLLCRCDCGRQVYRRGYNTADAGAVPSAAASQDGEYGPRRGSEDDSCRLLPRFYMVGASVGGRRRVEADGGEGSGIEGANDVTTDRSGEPARRRRTVATVNLDTVDVRLNRRRDGRHDIVIVPRPAVHGANPVDATVETPDTQSDK